jgi:ABC-type branched-subunit amino acid transport system ATPase component
VWQSAITSQTSANAVGIRRQWLWFISALDRVAASGEMQMLLVGGALVARPKLLMLDGPSVGLAPNIAEELFATIAAINREQGLTILLVEQNAHAAMALCDYGNIIESGRIVLHGTAGILGTLSIMRPDDGPPRRLIPTNACAACSA